MMHWIPAAGRGAVMLVLLAGSAVALAQGNAGRQKTVVKDSAAGRVVATVLQGEFDYVRIETREPGAPANQHPVAIDPAGLRGLLAALKIDRKPPVALFEDEELNVLVAPLVAALARATPEQDVSFAVTGKHGYFAQLTGRAVTTGRVFRRDDRLHVIIGLAQRDFEGQLRGSGYLIAFEPGQRGAPVDRNLKLVADGQLGQWPRADWVALDPASVAATAASVAATAASAPAAAPTPPAAALFAPPAPPPPAAPPPPSGDTLYRTTRERLAALQKLRDDGAITEQEYQEKRAQILRDL